MPNRTNVQHNITSLRAPARYIQKHGLDMQQCLQGTSIELADLHDSQTIIHLSQALHFYSNLRKISDDPYLGLTLGADLHLADYGMWGFALMSCNTFRQAVELGIRMIPLSYTTFDHQLVRTKQHAIHRMTPILDYGDDLPMLEDREVAAVHLIYRELLHDTPPLIGINLTHDRDSDDSYYQTHFGCPVRFNAPQIELIMPADAFDLKISSANPGTIDFFVQQCELLIAQLSKQSNLADEVRHLILARSGSAPSIDDVAAEMNMSSRTLRRRLREENTGYQSLLNEIRFKLAKDYLLNTDMRLEQIAAALGHNDPANFTHAFKHWAGISPREFRNTHAS